MYTSHWYWEVQEIVGRNIVLMVFGHRAIRQLRIPNSMFHGANMAPTWALSAPDGPHVGPMNLATRDDKQSFRRNSPFAKRMTSTANTGTSSDCKLVIPTFCLSSAAGILLSVGRGGMSYWFYFTLNYYDFQNNGFYYTGAYFTSCLLLSKCALVSDPRLNSSLPEQNGRHFVDDIFTCIFVNEKFD